MAYCKPLVYSLAPHFLVSFLCVSVVLCVSQYVQSVMVVVFAHYFLVLILSLFIIIHSFVVSVLCCLVQKCYFQQCLLYPMTYLKFSNLNANDCVVFSQNL